MFLDFMTNVTISSIISIGYDMFLRYSLKDLVIKKPSYITARGRICKLFLE